MTNAATGQVLFAKGIASSHDLGAIAKATMRARPADAGAAAQAIAFASPRVLEIDRSGSETGSVLGTV